MAVPFDCGALLPTCERYASPRFRRFVRAFDPYRVDYEDAVELVAFLQMVPPHAAKYIFGWKLQGVKAARSLVESEELFEAAQPLHEVNQRLVGVTDGLMVLSAMKDGGWRYGPVPQVVTDAAKGLRKEGLSLAKVAVKLGVSVDQASTIAKARKPKKHAFGPFFAS